MSTAIIRLLVSAIARRLGASARTLALAERTAETASRIRTIRNIADRLEIDLDSADPDEVRTVIQEGLDTGEVSVNDLQEIDRQMPVKYQDFTGIAFEVAQSKGFESSFESSQTLLSVVGEIWRERKDQIATRSDAIAVLEAELVVR